MLEQMTPLAAMLCDKAWMLLHNETGTPYWTSDHPVFLHNRIKDPYRSTLGLGCPGIEIHTPLSPRLALLIFDPVAWLPMYSVMPAQLTNVTFANAYQVSWSQRHVFASTGDFALAERMLMDTPGLGDPKRSRIRAE